MKIVSTSNGFVGALDVVRVKVLFPRFGLGHESCGAWTSGIAEREREMILGKM